jgi:alcohol-forming fatty acyl-CoA reductase
VGGFLIRQALQGKRIALTGVTGFVGTALFERLLVDIPVGRLDVVVRGDASTRLQTVLAGSAFNAARQQLGAEGFAALAQEKVRAISADLAAAPPTIEPDVDFVIHCAATVSFDPPVDDAFRTNLVGTTQLYAASGDRPFVHVSTAYVAGVTRGIQREELLPRTADWRAERDYALGLRAVVEEESRRPEVLSKLGVRARAAVGRAGPQSVAARTEELRKDWVAKRLIALGRARARSLGWPDVYTFTKALTEMALDDLAGDNPLAIVRPSIVESALERPFPGWIEGFRMAEPVILAYGRGALPDFPAIPEGALDVIPVDLVVNAILAVAAKAPERRSVYHVSSGSRNPMRFRLLYDLTREYFLKDPLPERGRGAFKVPTWNFPGSHRLYKRMRNAERALDAGERLVGKLPRGSFARETARRLDRLRGKFDFVKRYAGLYGPYVEAEVIYTDERAQALHESLPEEDRRDFGFDPTSFTWQHYLQEVHLPSITAPMRWPRAPREAPRVVVAPNGNGNGAPPSVTLAVFDVEGTIVASNVLESYLWLRMSENAGSPARAREIASVAARLPGLLSAERRDRGEFLRSFYRLYEGVGVDEIGALARDTIGDLLLRRLAPGAVRRIREHRAAGHRVVLVTGSLDFIVSTLEPLADEIVSARLAVKDGVYIGDLDQPPLTGEARASWLVGYARAAGADLSACYAYADSMSDLPMLEAAGKPVAVNPDVALTRIARGRGWPIEEWEASRGTPRFLVPEPAV